MMHFYSIISLVILLSCFTLTASKRIKSYIWAFRVQSLLIAAAAAVMGAGNPGSAESINMFIISAIIIGLKVIYIPGLLHKTFNKVEYRVGKDFFLNIPFHVLISCGLVMLSYFSVSSIKGLVREDNFTSIVYSVSVILIGLFFMISRKKAIGQIVGLLIIENGLFITAMFATEGMPLIIDLGIFIDLITAVLILGLLVFKINERFETIDTDKLKKLRG